MADSMNDRTHDEEIHPSEEERQVLMRIVADRYDRWARSGKMKESFARVRVSLGTVNRRVFESLIRKWNRGITVDGADIEAMTMVSINHKLSELIRKEERRGANGRMPQLSQVGDEGFDFAGTIAAAGTDGAPEAQVCREELLAVVRDLFTNPALADDEVRLLRHILVHGSINAAADAARLPRTTAQRAFKRLFAKLRDSLRGWEEGLAG